MLDLNYTNPLQAAMEAGMLLAPQREHDSHPYLVLPKDARVEDMERFCEHPHRIKRRLTMETLESFVQYLKDFRRPETRIFMAATGAENVRVAAVIDYHDRNEAGDEYAAWCDHVVEYTCPKTVEWKRWSGSDGKWADQPGFAEFLEFNLQDVVEPVGAAMLEVAQTLQAKTEVNFETAIKLSDGSVQLRYENVTRTTAGEKGEFLVPERFAIGIPLFQGGPRYKIGCCLRYRITEKKLTFKYQLINPHLVLEDATDSIGRAIGEATEKVPLRGWPTGI